MLKGAAPGMWSDRDFHLVFLAQLFLQRASTTSDIQNTGGTISARRRMWHSSLKDFRRNARSLRSGPR